jgi:hypothetical protein
MARTVNLRRTRYDPIDGVVHKSCPECSHRAGEYVYYPCDDPAVSPPTWHTHFGYRGEDVQPRCRRCPR